MSPFTYITIFSLPLERCLKIDQKVSPKGKKGNQGNIVRREIEYWLTNILNNNTKETETLRLKEKKHWIS